MIQMPPAQLVLVNVKGDKNRAGRQLAGEKWPNVSFLAQSESVGKPAGNTPADLGKRN